MNNVLLNRDGNVAYVTFNRPHRHNALDRDTAAAFHRCCTEIANDATVRAVVISGAGASFGVGGDLSEMQAAPVAASQSIIESMHAAIEILTALDAPVVASLHGHVAGGSMSLALSCDLAVAADNTIFNFSYINAAACADLSGSWHLPRLVGLRQAMGIALLSGPLDAQQALQLGVVNQVVASADLSSVTATLAKRLADGPTQALGKMKRLLRQSFDKDLSAQLADERKFFRQSAETMDFSEAIDEFLAKRQPHFRGQ